MPKRVDLSAVLDDIAQALILADPAEPATYEWIVRAAEALRRRVSRGAAHAETAAVAFCDEAKRLGSLPRDEAVVLLEELGLRFVPLQAAVLASGDAKAGAVRGRAPKAPAPASRPEVESSAETSGEVMPLAADTELMADFVVRAAEHLETAVEALLVLEKDPADGESLNAVFRAFHTIKGMAGFLALGDIQELSHRTESALDGPRKGTSTLGPEAFDAVFGAVDEMKRLVAAVGGPADAAAPTPAETAERPARAPSSAEKAPARVAAKNNVRVDEDRLDRMLDMIGELVIAESMFSEAVRAETSAFSSLAQQITRIDKITRELQEMATSLRMVTLRSTFLRMARLVRDVSHKAGKPIDFATVGDDIELDKLVVDRIADPLIHILRNAVDHGIESPEQRRAAGKPAEGRVELCAFHAGGRIHIEVTDDGCGLSESAILDAARRRGLVGDDETPTSREVVDLVFVPGLSTAGTVTDVSGRGVGMDVVRRTVESLRGEVDIATTSGAGTKISIRLPLTLAIIDGIVVRVGTERYIIPTLSIERSVRPEPYQLSSVVGRGDVLSVDGRLVPLVYLRDLFGIADAETDPSRGIVVILGQDGKRAGLVACEILGQQQIVIKSLGGAIQNTPGIAGGAIMPDGTVGLIVDVGGLVRLARH